GEKLYEKLSTLFEDKGPTEHDKVRIFVGNGGPGDDFPNLLRSLFHIFEYPDIGPLVVAFKEIVFDYNPSTHLLRRILEPQDRLVASFHEGSRSADKK